MPVWQADASRLNRLDFDFNGSETGYLTHGLHPYPAKFIPQIPNTLIRELSRERDVVADIFCGSGTTLVEALLLNRHAIGFDANPLACLITRGKTTRLGAGDREVLLATVQRAQDSADRILNAGKTLFDAAGPFRSSADRPADPALDFWFAPFVTEELAEILSWCRHLPNEAAQTVALVAFSSIIVAVSKQDSDTRYVRRQKKLVPGETMLRFARALSKAVSAVGAFTEVVDPGLRREIFRANLLEEPRSRPFDFMVCSPPYPNAYSYHLYHMTRMVWLGMDQAKFKREEIGSHRKYSGNGRSRATVGTFQSEMRTILRWLASHLKTGGYACFVVGDSTIRGERTSNADLISLAAGAEGFVEVARPTRRLQASKKAFNPAIGKIREERILVLRKERG
jgi:site-specific DNA-methyltransferase (cytosine-N4-specific)